MLNGISYNPAQTKPAFGLSEKNDDTELTVRTVQEILAEERGEGREKIVPAKAEEKTLVEEQPKRELTIQERLNEIDIMSQEAKALQERAREDKDTGKESEKLRAAIIEKMKETTDALGEKITSKKNGIQNAKCPVTNSRLYA